ncbi:MAG: alkene reductase [Bacteroidetes bacterium]|nr:alkene reductase [Bacteroidota bacterium]
MSNNLFDKFKLGDIILRNRIVMAPLTRSRANNPEHKPTELIAEYYRQRASIGLIISEGSQVSPMGVGYVNTPGIYSDEQVEGWKLVTEAVHNEGGKIFIQLWHVGRLTHPYFLNGELPLAPSAINPNHPIRTPEGEKRSVTPKEMTKEDIKMVINEFAVGATNAVKAGLDGVEIHSSNGYLLHQFFAPCSNTRTDKYGGSIENRVRIMFELLDEMKKYIPENRIGVRLNPSSHNYHGLTIDEETLPTFDYLINKLNDYELAYLHLSEPFTDVTNVPFAEPNIAKRYRKIYKGNLMINKGFTLESGNEIIKNGGADLVAFGTPTIANPDLVYRMKNDIPLAVADKKKYYSIGGAGYTDYPSFEEI